MNWDDFGRMELENEKQFRDTGKGKVVFVHNEPVPEVLEKYCIDVEEFEEIASKIGAEAEQVTIDVTGAKPRHRSTYPYGCDRDCSILLKEADLDRGREIVAVSIRYLAPDLPPLQYVDGKSDWIDLYTAETVHMNAGDFALIPLGVAMKLPKGYEAVIAPRSSTFRKYGILQANSIGVVDETYCGDGDEWKFAAFATEDVEIEKGTRLCQFRLFRHQPQIHFCSVESLGSENRGGFGSTGD